MKIIALGDSCTYGQGVRASEAWPAVLERLTGHDVRNAGVCGDTTRLALERFFRDVAMHRPDIVCLQLGANDANRWGTDFGAERVGIRAYVENMHDLIARAHAIRATVVMLRPHQPKPRMPETTDPNYHVRVTEYALALKDEGWDFCHAAPAVSLLNDGYGVHPDVAMHERYAKLVAEAL